MSERDPWQPAPADDDEAVAFAHRMLDLARRGDPALIAYVDAGVPVELTEHEGNTLLMLAAYHGHAEVVGELAQRGADPSHPNDRGQTPLAGAVFKGETAVIDVLLAVGADPYAGEPSAVAAATLFERTDLLERLTAHPGPDPES